MTNTNLKKVSKKFIIQSLILTAITFILGMMFFTSLDGEYIITGGEKSTFLKDVNASELGGFLPFWLFFELASYAFLAFYCIVIPVGVNVVLLFNNIIARLFQIGENKNWKNIVTKTILFICIVFQGLLSAYILFLAIAFTGYTSQVYIMYAIFFVNAVGFVKGIVNMINKKEKSVENPMVNSQIM